MGTKSESSLHDMENLTRNQAGTIFKARVRIINCKGNQTSRNKVVENCRKCKIWSETQEHILEICPSIHTEITSTTKKEEIFHLCPSELRTTAKRIIETIEIFESNKTTSGNSKQSGTERE